MRFMRHSAGIDASALEKMMISRMFLDHPRSVNETYLQHMAFAGWFASKLFAAGFAAAVHAIFPNCFEKTASTIIAELYERTHKRGR